MSDEKDHEFARTYDPKRPPEAYDWVLKYGREKIDLCSRLVDVLEAKAESLIRYIGGIALATSAGLPFLSKGGLMMMATFSPSFILLSLAAIYCFKAIRPKPWTALPTIDQAFRYADYFDRDAVVRFHATMTIVEGRLASLIEWKAKAINIAQAYFLSALLWLPVVAVLSSVLNVFCPGSAAFFRL